eukprot:6780661-Pyramimonas_sp.AAC.1
MGSSAPPFQDEGFADQGFPGALHALVPRSGDARLPQGVPLQAVQRPGARTRSGQSVAAKDWMNVLGLEPE